MEKFLDNKSAEYSIHQISLMGESVDRKPVGTWFGPNTVAQVRIYPSYCIALLEKVLTLKLLHFRC